jgi:FtsP/CotA-like multicopper oxidase with cupredoxin domain
MKTVCIEPSVSRGKKLVGSTYSYLDRRQFLIGAACASLTTIGGVTRTAVAQQQKVLRPSAGRISLLSNGNLDIDGWTYNGQSPGQTLHFKQGETLNVKLVNDLSEDTSIHWHGIRTPNSMDGVPYVTQAPVKPGKNHFYSFECPDAGTYWYHPHSNSQAQVGRGLCGAIVVEEDKPIEVDRDLVWVVADWRIGKDNQAAEDFGRLHDNSHAGRLGNKISLNGKVKPNLIVKPGERLRLRIINAATARIFSPKFSGISGWIVAMDGHPIEPRPIEANKHYLSPGNRWDLIIDVPLGAASGAEYIVSDQTYRGRGFTLATLSRKGRSIRSKLLAPPKRMRENPLSIPELSKAAIKSIVFEGGAMGRMNKAFLDSKEMPLRELVKRGFVWSANGKIHSSLQALKDAERLLNLKRGSSYIFKLENRTAFPHPIHLHGHAFQVVARQGLKIEEPIWLDTVLVFPKETVDIAFVADNPGDWLLHCHVLGHAAAGMMAAISVA